jgi:heat-inducible transcriptional repressor
MTIELTERQGRILALVVREHIADARPVASGRLVRDYDLGVSAATVRHELAALEELGLLVQPHTSAGRVPSMTGFRHFVEHLMERAGLSESEQTTIRHQFHQAGHEPERWMQLSAAVIAHSSGAAGLVATPRDRTDALRRLEMIDLGDGLVQIIAVMASGSVRQARWRPEDPYDQAVLDRISNRINAHAREHAGRAPAVPTEAGPIEISAMTAVQEILGGRPRPAALRLYHAGLTQILYEPEFSELDHLTSVVDILEHGQGLEPVMAEMPSEGVQVIMGGEPPLETAPCVTMILSRFGPDEPTSGIVGVIGPVRLPYERAVPAVGFVARLMTKLLAGEVV